MFGLDLLKLIDTRIEAHRQKQTATGTVQERQSAGRASVTFDGSALAVPVKVLAHVQAHDGSRVTLAKFGSEWVVVGAFGGTGDLVAVQSATTNSAAVSSETTVITLTGFTFEPQAVYRIRVGGRVQGSEAGYSLWRIRDRATGPFPVDWGQFGHYPHPVADVPFALYGEHYLAHTESTPLEGQTIAVTATASSGTVQHIGTATKPRYLEIERCPGPPSGYPHAVIM